MPKDDPFYGKRSRPKCLPFIRSQLGTGCQPGQEHQRDVVNGITAFVDGSFVYGSGKKESRLLRAFSGGQMKVSEDKRGREFPPLIKADDVGMKMDFGWVSLHSSIIVRFYRPPFFSDARGDVHPGLTLFHTLFLRNHNKLVKELAKINPGWNDERLYQEAR